MGVVIASAVSTAGQASACRHVSGRSRWFKRGRPGIGGYLMVIRVPQPGSTTEY